MFNLTLPILEHCGDQFDVLLLDAWGTLFKGPFPEPPGDTQEILGYKCKPGQKLTLEEVDPEFLQVCLTTPIEDPHEFLVYIANRFELPEPTKKQHGEFQDLIKYEKRGLLLYYDVKDALEVLRNKYNKRLGLLSNVWPFPIKWLLKRCGIDHYFEEDGLILSYEVRYAKPSPQIFQLACERFNVPRERALMIGDSTKLDIEGALRFGMPAVHIDRYPKRPPVRVPGVPVINELAELWREPVDD
jgi:HAD superfamily hydrolase (TIGR01549 family)